MSLCNYIGYADLGRIVMFELDTNILNTLNKLEISFSSPLLQFDNTNDDTLIHCISVIADDKEMDVKWESKQNNQGLISIRMSDSVLEQLHTSSGAQIFVTFVHIESLRKSTETTVSAEKNITDLKLYKYI